MRSKLNIPIDFDETGFKRYVSYQCGMAAHYIEIYEVLDLTIIDYEAYAEAVAIMDLDEQFRSFLNEEEKAAIHFLSYHNPNENPPENYRSLISSAYRKWYRIFYKKNKEDCPDINPKRLGKIMKRIRLQNDIKTAHLARMTEVDRSTVSLYESGSRMPSLNYIHKFCFSFGLKIDTLIALSFENTINKTNLLEIMDKKRDI